MKRLTVALLVFGLFTPIVSAQSVEQANLSERGHIFSGWLEMVRDAESAYKKKNGRYGDLAALRKAHLLRGLVFESGLSKGLSGTAEANFVPKSAEFQLTVSADGQHFRAVIGDTCMSVSADDSGNEVGMLDCHRDIPDSPEGLIFTR